MHQGSLFMMLGLQPIIGTASLSAVTHSLPATAFHAENNHKGVKWHGGAGYRE